MTLSARLRSAHLHLASAGLAVASMAVDCGPDEPINPVGTDEVTLSKHEVLIPFASAIDGVVTQEANNNLDVAVFQGRTFLAWRTAPSHFASAETVMYVASEGPDGWRFEGAFSQGTDLREPRFLVLDDRLILYFAVLGTNPFAFEPQGMMVTEYHGQDDWDEPEWLYEEGFIPWRAKVEDGKAYLIGYVGGENIYEVDGEPIRLHFLTTEDGRTLEPVVPGQPVVLEGGGSEADFTFLEDGSLIAVQRNEAGDEASGWGSKICRAPANDLGNWTCQSDKKKYDSPLVFEHDGEVWLVARRNVTESGHYDLDQDELSAKDQTETYLVEYSFNPKRCALWHVYPESLTVEHEIDLPSRGDTCFASQLPKDDDTVTIYNYSNELEDAVDCKAWPGDCTDVDWWVGQSQATIIYRIDATLP